MKTCSFLLLIAFLVIACTENAPAQQAMKANNRKVVNNKPLGKVVNVAAIEPVVNKLAGFYPGKTKHKIQDGAQFSGNGSIKIKKLSATRILVSFKSNLVGVPNIEAEKEIDNDMGIVNITVTKERKTSTLHIQLTAFRANNGTVLDAITARGIYSYDRHTGSFEMDGVIPKDNVITY